MTIRLRDYQEQCLADLARHRQERPDATRLAVQMATGLGKTITFAHEAETWLCNEGSQDDTYQKRVLILVHTDELTRQAEQKIRMVCGHAWDIGVVKAERNETDADIIVASVQTLANPERRVQITDVGHIIVDECHHAIAQSYRSILVHYGAMCACWTSPDNAEGPLRECPDHGDGSVTPTTVTGYTATLERGDGNSLASIWQDVVFSRSISWGVRRGYLIPPRAYRVEVPSSSLGADQLQVTNPTVLDAQLVDSIAPDLVVDQWFDHAEGRSTVLFAPLVRSANTFAEAFRNAGVHAVVIHGGMPTEDRRLALKQYEAGEIDVLCNAMVLTEGWDVPRTECVIVARPTQSRPLFVQMVGRGLRPWLESPTPREDQHCVLLVVADATTDLCSVADLSDRPIVAADGKTLTELEDEFDLSGGLAPDEDQHYTGVVHAREFDPLIQRSSKVWHRTKGGTFFLPYGDRAWVFIVHMDGDWMIYATGPQRNTLVGSAPDLELAMALAEDTATDLGGNLAALYADKNRAWRKGTPTREQQDFAIRLGLTQQLKAITSERRSGKAGRLSDLIEMTVASRRIDPVVGVLTRQ